MKKLIREYELSNNKENLDTIKLDLDKQYKDVVTSEVIAEVVELWTGVPVNQIVEEEAERLLKLEEILHDRVVGQDQAVKSISRAIRRSRAGLKRSKQTNRFIFILRTYRSWKNRIIKSISRSSIRR